MSRELVEELRNAFEYHPDGYLIRKSTGKPCRQFASRLDGYVDVSVNGRMLPVHRIIFAIVHGKTPKGGIKHINGNRMDNRIKNLRGVSITENLHNSKKTKTDTSGLTGIYWHTQAQRWIAQIYVNNRQIHLGYFDDFEEAVRARTMAKIKYHPSSPEAARFARALKQNT